MYIIAIFFELSEGIQRIQIPVNFNKNGYGNCLSLIYK
jgi:hypothetical protein